GVAPINTSGDGIPDYYKEAVGLDPSVANSLTPGTGGYTKLESYLNWLALPHAVTTTNTPVYVDLSQYARGFTNWSPVYIVSNPSNGTVTVSSSHIVDFTPDLGFTGLAGFQFVVTANDGSDMTNTVNICVTPYNAVATAANPVFTSISNSSNNVAFTGIGGIPNANFVLFSSTNLTTPLPIWIPLTTNNFDSSGDFNFTAPAPLNASQSFYILEIP
ncbi:MAG: Ig-like domain-containing protein, partial [Limisphaerales bacterium]